MLVDMRERLPDKSEHDKIRLIYQIEKLDNLARRHYSHYDCLNTLGAERHIEWSFDGSYRALPNLIRQCKIR